MKAILSLKRHGYLKTVGVFLIAVALIAGIVGCEGEPEPEFNVTMAENPAVGGTATDQTGTSPYEEGEIVDIEAVAADCYRFVDWTAPAGAFGNANNATTTFTMPARDVTVTANFELVPPDHFKFYGVDGETALPIDEDVQLVDQFGTFEATVGKAVLFGNPVEKEHGDIATPIADLNRHYTLYELLYEEDPQSWKVTVNNQFQDDVELTVVGPYYLAVPTQKEDHEMPVCLNHFLVYDAYGPVVNDEVVLSDQFIQDQVAVVYEPLLFANPVQKAVDGVVTDIEKPNEHWVLYDIEGPPIDKRIQIDNQFGDEQTLDLLHPEFLAVPSQKISWEQPLDHFKVYSAWGTAPEEDVQLVDQFGTINATVGEPWYFANPTNKWHGDAWTPISNPDNHLMLYTLDHEETPPTWYVQVNNQFGEDQWLWVTGPYFLAVPTKKGSQDPPVDLDHYSLYMVTDYANAPEEVVVGLADQWIDSTYNMYAPYLFANPVQKIHGDVVTDIKYQNDHLVFYLINNGEFQTEGIPIIDQFGPQLLNVDEVFETTLGVPSEKVEWSLVD